MRVVIRFQELPILSQLDPAVYGSPESAITKEIIARELNGISVDEVNTIQTTHYYYGEV